MIFQEQTVNPQKGVEEKKKEFGFYLPFLIVRENSLYSTASHIMKTQGWEKKIQMARKTVTGDYF